MDIPLWFTEYHKEGTGITFKIKRVLVTKFSEYQRIDIVETEDWGRMLLLNGCVMLTERDEFIYHEMLVHPAMVIHPNPKHILVVGGGDGGTIREVLKYEMVEKAVLAELDREVVELAKIHLPGLSSSLEDPRVRIEIGDALDFLKKTQETFDVIFIDSTDPVGPAEVLFSSEFYKLAKEHLNKDGIVALQAESPFHHLDIIKKVKKRLKEVFNRVEFYVAPVPTYPGGYWAFAIASLNDKLEPLREPPRGLKYYNTEIHRASFMLPQFMKDEGI